MNNLRAVVACLMVVNIVSALGVVYSKHNSRMLFKKTRVLNDAIDRANVDWGRLQIEESTLARYGRIEEFATKDLGMRMPCLLYTSPSPRDATLSRMPSSA